MGARGNIVVKDDFSDGEVFLYFHWSGHNIEKIVKEALSLKQRWDDSQYLTNIIYSVAYESKCKRCIFGLSLLDISAALLR